MTNRNWYLKEVIKMIKTNKKTNQKYTYGGLMYVLVVLWGSTYTKSLKSTENLTSFCSPSEYRKTTCSWDLGFRQMYWKEMKLRWHKRKKLLLHKCKDILHPTSMTQQLLQQKLRAKKPFVSFTYYF